MTEAHPGAERCRALLCCELQCCAMLCCGGPGQGAQRSHTSSQELDGSLVGQSFLGRDWTRSDGAACVYAHSLSSTVCCGKLAGSKRQPGGSRSVAELSLPGRRPGGILPGLYKEFQVRHVLWWRWILAPRVKHALWRTYMYRLSFGAAHGANICCMDAAAWHAGLYARGIGIVALCRAHQAVPNKMM